MTKTPQAICLGELLVDFVADQIGDLHQVTRFSHKPGGAPANVAIAMQRLGLQSGFITKVGEGSFGQFLSEVVQREGVDTSYLQHTYKARTGLAFVWRKENGDREFSFHRDPSADMLLSKRDIEENYFRQCQCFHYGSISLISELSREATYQAIKYAQRFGSIISYDPNLRLTLWDSHKEAKERILEGMTYADMVKVSEEEIRFLTGSSDPQAGIDFFRSKGVKLALLTYGSQGAWLVTSQIAEFVPSFQLQAIDTTGAGDAFAAAVLYQLVENRMIAEKLGDIHVQQARNIVTFAHAAGALTTTQAGAIPALPTREEVNEMIQNEKKSA